MLGRNPKAGTRLAEGSMATQLLFYDLATPITQSRHAT